MRGTIKYNDVKFVISEMDKAIVSITNKGKRKDIYIPSVFPSGETVHTLNANAFKGEFGKVTISDGISRICSCAFSEAKVEEVIWSSSCKEIPYHCFIMSRIQKISNIENVTVIEQGAFAHSSIRSFDWPANCCVVPPNCFFCCSLLKHISGLNNVNEIKQHAFSGIGNISGVDAIDLSMAHILFIGQEAFYGISPEKVILPYYFNDEKSIF